jgi:hypothetical protein
MKRVKIICLFLGLFFILTIFGFAVDEVQQQTYVSRIILTAPWGQKNLYMDKEASSPGQFGIFDPYTRNPKAFDEGPVQGPSTFTIAANGDIYIVDTFNNRIQRFTQAGTFVSSIPAAGSGWVEDICVDRQGNLYLLYLGPAAVWQVDPTGKVIKIIYMFNHQDKDAEGMNTGGGSTHIYCDNSDRLFLSYRKDNEGTQAIFQLGTAAVEYTPDQQKATLRKGSAGTSGSILNKNQTFQFIDGNIFTVDNLGKTVTEFKSLGSYSFLDVDSLNYIYLIAYSKENDMFTIRKQNPEGKFISSFEWRNINYAHHNLNKPITIDSQGNIYVFDSSKEGITITKWSPSGGK